MKDREARKAISELAERVQELEKRIRKAEEGLTIWGRDPVLAYDFPTDFPTAKIVQQILDHLGLEIVRVPARTEHFELSKKAGMPEGGEE